MPDPLDLSPLPSSDVLAHVVDVHCHPTDSRLDEELLAKVSHRLCAMATRGTDQELVAILACRYPDKVVPCFGPSRLHNMPIASLLPPNRVSSLVRSLDFSMRFTIQRGPLSRSLPLGCGAQTRLPSSLRPPAPLPA